MACGPDLPSCATATPGTRTRSKLPDGAVDWNLPVSVWVPDTETSPDSALPCKEVPATARLGQSSARAKFSLACAPAKRTCSLASFRALWAGSNSKVSAFTLESAILRAPTVALSDRPMSLARTAALAPS